MSVILKQTPGKNIQFNRAGISIRISKLTPRNDAQTAAKLSWLHSGLKHIK